ncbi:MAG: hypothetical protein AB7F43_11355 [Bacteriovoracia bacterium]
MKKVIKTAFISCWFGACWATSKDLNKFDSFCKSLTKNSGSIVDLLKEFPEQSQAFLEKLLEQHKLKLAEASSNVNEDEVENTSPEDSKWLRRMIQLDIHESSDQEVLRVLNWWAETHTEPPIPTASSLAERKLFQILEKRRRRIHMTGLSPEGLEILNRFLADLKPQKSREKSKEKSEKQKVIVNNSEDLVFEDKLKRKVRKETTKKTGRSKKEKKSIVELTKEQPGDIYTEEQSETLTSENVVEPTNTEFSEKKLSVGVRSGWSNDSLDALDVYVRENGCLPSRDKNPELYERMISEIWSLSNDERRNERIEEQDLLTQVRIRMWRTQADASVEEIVTLLDLYAMVYDAPPSPQDASFEANRFRQLISRIVREARRYQKFKDVVKGSSVLAKEILKKQLEIQSKGKKQSEIDSFGI